MEKITNRCEARRGSNVCGREAKFLITEISVPGAKISYFTCEEDVGAIMIEREIERSEVERIYN